MEFNNPDMISCKSPIIKRLAWRRRLRQQTPSHIKPAVLTTIPDTPDDDVGSHGCTAALTTANFAHSADGSPQEGAIAVVEQEATLPFSDVTFCSALEPEATTAFKPEASVFIEDENSKDTYCSDIENLDIKNTSTTKPALLFESKNAPQEETPILELFDSAAANDSQDGGNLTAELDFNTDETVYAQPFESSSQCWTQEKSSTNSFELEHPICNQTLKPSVLNNRRKKQKGRGKKGRSATTDFATQLETPPDSGSLGLFESPPSYYSLLTEHKRHSRDPVKSQNSFTSTQNHSSQSNASKERARYLVTQVRALRKAVDDWVITDEGLGDPVETRKIVESVKREAGALMKEVEGPVKIELEHVLQACEYITLQLQYVPYHSTKSENSVGTCKRKREDLTFPREQEEQTGDLPSLKEMLTSTAIRPGHCNLTLNIRDGVVEKGSLDSKGHIYGTKGRVYLSAEAWYRESMPRKTIVTRDRAYKNMLYRGVSLLYFCKISSSTKTSNHLSKRTSTRKQNEIREQEELGTQEMEISHEQQEIPNVRHMKERLSKNLVSEVDTLFSQSTTSTNFSDLQYLPEAHDIDTGPQRGDSNKESEHATKISVKNDEPMQRKSEDSHRQLASVPKCNSWLSKEQVPDVPVIPEICVPQEHKNSELQRTDSDTNALHLQVSTMKIMLPVREARVETTASQSASIPPESNNKTLPTVSKEEALVQSLMDNLDNELSPVKSYYVPTFRGEESEASRLSEKTLVLNKWHERLTEWKTNSNSQLRQSIGLKSTNSPKHQAKESTTTLLQTLSEKVRMLEENFTELKRSTEETKSGSSHVSCQESVDNSSRKFKDKPKVCTPRHVVNKSYSHASSSQPAKWPSTSLSQPLYNSAEKLHGNKLETVKRNLGTWFSNSSRISQKLQGNMNPQINVDQSNTK